MSYNTCLSLLAPAPAPHQEAVNINQSLFVLRRVITALSRRDSSHEEDTRPGE